MKQDIFRKKSLERIQSPDQIDDYVRVVTPSLWLLLGAIVLLLTMGIMWGVMTRVEAEVTHSDG
ncbi:MAG TPA: NHLP bacteriocin system secretion protein, partial [Lachnospiraceae bacterium]|nr:NHLP bacteriocin system secretion protein [Lachnospiraceae bacterium]